MIEINLLPGATRKSRGSGGFDLAALTGSIGSRIRDPYLLTAVGAGVVAIVAVGLMHVSHASASTAIEARYDVARADSVRYAAVIADRRSAEAQRDSVIRQIDIIRSIDDDRFIWAHIMEEVSRALPAYTWLITVQQTSAVVTAAATVEVDAQGKPVADASAEVPDGPSRAPKFRIVGQTVDIQALTHFMKTLEASPFIQRVQLSRSDMALADGKQITEFHLDAEYEIPPREQLRTVPINLAVR